METKYTYRKIFALVLPSIAMQIFVSLYVIVDGIFIANCLTDTAFAAINLSMPILMVAGGLGVMIGTGGNALVSKLLGEGKKEEANQMFSNVIWICLLLGLLITGILLIFFEPILHIFTDDPALVEDALLYGRIFLIAQPFNMVSLAFSALYHTTKKGRLGLRLTIASGVVNIAFDALFILAFGWGIPGAAVASVLGQVLGGLFPVIYFAFPHKGVELRLRFCRFQWKGLGKVFTNGVSEFIVQTSFSIVNILYNYQLLRFIGADGVAAYGVIMYVGYIFAGVLVGYSLGIAPAISFHYGAGEKDQINLLYRRSLIIVFTLAIVLFAFCELGAYPFAYLYATSSQTFFDLTVIAFQLYAFAYLTNGVSIFASGLFTAFNNGFISGLISFTRAFVFQILCIFLLPVLFGPNGLWAGYGVADFLALFVTVPCLVHYRDRYGYRLFKKKTADSESL